MNRRQWLKSTLLAGAANGAEACNGALDGTAFQETNATESEAEVHKLLGFSTMTGEDPLKMWARLQNAREWLAGPLSPDGWCGQAYIADNSDIFAFRFLTIPHAWINGATPGKLASYCQQHAAEWFKNWPSWWHTVGPKAPDDSYARLLWQMPDGGPTVTYRVE
jgi:hypothetical protein